MKHSTELTIRPEQTSWTPAQQKTLEHMGVAGAEDADLSVFFHVCRRTGLDPFARQIHMIARNANEKDADGNWVKKTKWTIQTGIDGFRLIGHRASGAVSVDAAEWLHEDGSWRPAWSKRWGYPIAARVTIRRDGQPFTATAMFDEYAATKYGGELTSMWAQRPAGQLAKCAEALAWRMACPQDLAGLYADEEMGQADSVNAKDAEAEQAAAAAPERNAETMLAEAWDDAEKLRKLLKWSRQRGAPDEYLNRAQQRLDILEDAEPVDAEIVPEPEGETTQ